MSTDVRIAVSVARAWVHLYTSRMSPELRETRRAEIDADLWDHHRDAQEGSTSTLVTALEILLRTGLGVLDDLSWCVEARQSERGTARTGRSFTMGFSARQTRWMGIFSVTATAIVLMMFGVVPTLTSYFASAGIPLPLPTRIVMSMSVFLTGYWWAFVGGGVVLVLVMRRLDKSAGGTVLARVAAIYDDETDNAAEALLTKMEPIMIVGLSFVVGAMILAMFLPMFDVVNALK